MTNVVEFPRRDIAYRYGLLRAAGMDGETREEMIQECIQFAERMIESAGWTEVDLRDMIERKRERLLRQLEDVEKLL